MEKRPTATKAQPEWIPCKSEVQCGVGVGRVAGLLRFNHCPL